MLDAPRRLPAGSPPIGASTSWPRRPTREIAENPRGALLLLWAAQRWQVRIEGSIHRLAPEESDAYFRQRPRDSQIGAWASHQSDVIPDRAGLEARVGELADRYRGQDVPRPPHWGGYRLAPESFEFWQSRRNRLHDRLRYRRQHGGWTIERLSP